MSVQTQDTAGAQTGSEKSVRKLALPLIIAFTGVAILAVGVAMLVFNGSSSAVSAIPQVGKALPNFTLTDLAGKQVSLSDYAGRPVLINAWATWCPPCQQEMPDLHELYQKYQAKGFTILAIDGGEDGSIVKSFVQQRGFTFPVLLDSQTALLDKFGIRDYPTSIFVGKDGKVKLLQVGILTPDAIKNVVEPLISQ